MIYWSGKRELGNSQQPLLSSSSVVFQPLPPGGLRGCQHVDRTWVSEKAWTETVAAPWGNRLPPLSGVCLSPARQDHISATLHAQGPAQSPGHGRWRISFFLLL